MNEPKLSKGKQLLADLKAATAKRRELKRARKKEMLDERYHDMTEFEEAEHERHERIMNTPGAWQ